MVVKTSLNWIDELDRRLSSGEPFATTRQWCLEHIYRLPNKQTLSAMTPRMQKFFKLLSSKRKKGDPHPDQLDLPL
jgi:hypothetical protein